MEADDFLPTPGEIDIFGNAHGERLAFETINYNYQDLDIVKAAIVWYARYLDYPKMQTPPKSPAPNSD